MLQTSSRSQPSISMAKRVLMDMSLPPEKKVCTSQSSIHKFFKSTCSTSTSKPMSGIQFTPDYFGIHMYKKSEIEEARGLDRDYKHYWNEKVIELCNDKQVRHKLKDKGAIQGAVNTSWSLHKSELLQIQADELHMCIAGKYTKERAYTEFYTIKANIKKVMELTETIRLLYTDASKEMGGEVAEMMRVLRLAQSALKKAIDRKRQEINRTSHVKEGIVEDPQPLSAQCLNDIAEEIRTETNELILQPSRFETDDTAAT